MSKRKKQRTIYVYADWIQEKGPLHMGILTSEQLRGKEIFSFTYDDAWLNSEYCQELDPDLLLYAGPQYLNDQRKSNFGLFLDSSPDRWGRILMRRREAAMARAEQRPSQTLFETDYLLGVFDGHRMGGLRFKTDPDGPFLNDNKALATPPWTSIRALEEISMRLEDDSVMDDPEYLKWLNMLVAPGSSLGGARPKAGVVDANKQLWIAKFPSLADRSDIGGWEMVTHELATAAGINIAEAQARRFSSPHHTFLTKRFDRTEQGGRIYFASAMTLLGYTDGMDNADDVSYLELVEFIMSHGAEVQADLEELWRRIVFNICVSNTDDHLRNHGFILTPQGWVLSPAYDINPIETGAGLKLNISESDNALSLELAMEVHPYFRISATKAEEIIMKVKEAVQQWRRVATKYGISRAECELKRNAFSKSSGH